MCHHCKRLQAIARDSRDITVAPLVSSLMEDRKLMGMRKTDLTDMVCNTVAALCLILLTLSFCSPPANAYEAAAGSSAQIFTNKAINAACNASAWNVESASLTCAYFELSLTHVKDIRIEFKYARSTATAINMVIETSHDGAAPWAVESISDGAWSTAQMGGSVLSWPVSASGSFSVQFTDVLAQKARFRIYTTGGDAADVINELFVTFR